MRLTIFGLSVSSAWGNGHATLWRGLCGALARRGHHVTFFERDVPYYAAHRDLAMLDRGDLILYEDWNDVLPTAKGALAETDVAIVTSYCPDGIAACDLVTGSNVERSVFYDLDTPITLDALRSGRAVSYLPPGGLGDFDIVLSYTGGAALTELRTRLGARHVAPLYGSVDAKIHHRTASRVARRADLSYLGTYAEDRQDVLLELFIEPARRLPDRRFMIGGAQYPASFPWTSNVFFRQHVPPAMHAAFYAESRITLNVTRAAMAKMGYCPSGRLFEAAACGVPLLSDNWAGLDHFFEPGAEILVARTTDDTVDALSLSDAELERIAEAAMTRVLEHHTADQRALDLERILDFTIDPDDDSFEDAARTATMLGTPC